MSQQDLFRSLGAGLRFNRKRFADDVAHFSAEGSRSRAESSSALARDVESELDFFKTSDPASSNSKPSKPRRTRRRRRRGASDAGDEDSGAESDGGDDATAPAEGETASNVAEVRRKHRVHVLGDNIPPPITSFTDLPARAFLLRNLAERAKYASPTPIQMQAAPLLLARRQLLAFSPTGSGKTAAFAVPILAALKRPARREGNDVRSVVLCPTRELAEQIRREFEVLARGEKFRISLLTKAGKSDGTPETRVIDVLVSTPLRLVALLQQEVISLAACEFVVLDEADKLLELGFLKQIDAVFAAASNPRVTRALFSATLSQGVEEMASTLMHNSVRVLVGAHNATADTVKQELVYVGREDGKLLAIRQRLADGMRPPVLIFVQSKERAQELFHELVYEGVNVDVIHADRTQKQRDAVVRQFRAGKIWILITTDLMARGIDFKGVNLVINYDFPQSVVSYIHRIGRTGRMGRKGHAITLFTDDDVELLRMVANVMRDSGCDVPEWMLKLKNPGKRRRKELQKKPLERKSIKHVVKYMQKMNSKKQEMIQASKRRVEKKQGGQEA